MNGHRLFLAFAAICLTSSIACADEPATVERIVQDIQKLGHTRYQVRQQATLDLVSIGEPALKSLKVEQKSADAEVRQRADSIVRAIEGRLRNQSLILAPKLHLKYDSKPLDDAIADLSQKSGLPFTLDPKSGKNPKQSITLDTGDVFYWDAVEKFLAVAELVEVTEVATPAQPQAINGRWNGQGGQRGRRGLQPNHRILLTEQRSPLPVAVDSAIRVKVLPKEVPGNSITKGSNEISLLLDVTAAPSLAWQGCVNVDIRKAIDDRGFSMAQSYLRGSGPLNDMTIENFQMQAMLQGGQVIVQRQFGGGQLILSDDGTLPGPIGNPRHVSVTLLGKENGSKILKELHGVITGQVLTPPQALVTIENIHKVAGKDRFENGEYHLEVIEQKTDKAGFVHLRFRMEAPAPNNGENWQFGFAPNNGDAAMASGQPHLIFEDAAGKAIRNISLNILEQSFNGETQSIEYMAVVPTRADAKEAVKLVLSGRRLACIEVPFVLKNVPLP